MTNAIWQFPELRYQVREADGATDRKQPGDEDEVDVTMEVHDVKVSGGHLSDENVNCDAHWYQLLKH